LETGWMSWARENDGLNPRRGAIRRQRRRSIARGRADHSLDGRALGNHLLDLRDEHRHAEVLERTAVRVAAELDPQVVHAHDLPEAFGPEQIRAAFVKRDDVVILDLGQNPFLLAPDARTVGPLVALVAVLEKFHPSLGVAPGERLEIVPHLQQRVAARAVIDDGIERIRCSALRVDALKPGSI